MKTVVTSGLVVEHQRCWLGLAGLVANLQERGMVPGISRSVFTKAFGPVVGDSGEIRVRAASRFCDQLRQRVGEVFVISDPEAVALHDDMAAKTARIIEKRDNRVTFRGRENGSCNRVAAL